MRFSATLSSARFGRRPLRLPAILIVGALAVYELAQYILDDDITGIAFAAMLVVGGALVVGILNNWRNGVYFFLSWLLFEDFARKFLGNNMAIYFAKDFLLLVVIISFFSAYRRKELTLFRPPFIKAVLIFVWFGILQIFNPASTSVWYGFMGVKIFFYYIPLTYLGYSLLNSEKELRKFFTVNLILTLIIVSIGIAQSIIGPSFLNPAVQADDLRELSTSYRVAPQSGLMAYRPTSVFVSGGRYADFVNLAWLLVLGFGGYLLLRHKRGRVLAFIAIPVTATGAFLTASRGSFLWCLINAIVTSVAFFWGAPWRQGEVIRVIRTVQRAAIGMVLGMVLLFYAYPDALLSRLAIYQETLSPNSSSNELGHRAWTYPVANFMGAFDYERWPYGYGIGTTALGGQYVARFFHVKAPVAGVESGFGTLVVEMGVGGLILWLVMSSAIVASGWTVVKKLRGSPWFPLAFVILWYSWTLLFPATFGGMASYEDFLLNAYFWLLLGILFRLPRLAFSAEFALDAPGAQPLRPGVR